MSERWERRLVPLFIVIYALAAILVALNRYLQFNAFWYDFGIFDSTVWQLSRFKLPVIPQLKPPQGLLVWADHFNPSIALLSPFYWFTNKQEVMIVLQVVVVCSSAMVAYLIARREVRSSFAHLALVASYLGFVGMQNALFTDVHNIVFATLPLMLVIWAILAKKWKLYWLFLALTIGVQENMALIGVGMGMYLLMQKGTRKVGVATIIFSGFYFLAVIKLVIPFFKGSAYTYQPNLPKSAGDLMRTFFLPQIKTRTIFFTLLTFGFLPIASVASWFLIVWQYFERFVLNTAATRWDLGMHYNAVLSPIMFLAALDILKKMQRKKMLSRLINIWAFFTLAAVILLHRFVLHGPLMMATMPAFYQATSDTKFLYTFVDRVPRNKFIMVQNNLGSQFTHEKMVLLNRAYNMIKPEVIVFDTRSGQNANNFFPLSFQQVEKMVASLEKDKNYKKITITDRQFYFERK